MGLVDKIHFSDEQVLSRRCSLSLSSSSGPAMLCWRMTPPLSPSIRPSVVLSTRSLLFLPSDGGRGREDGKGTDVFSLSLRKALHSDVGLFLRKAQGFSVAVLFTALHQ